MCPNAPTAGGTDAAQQSPRAPFRTSSVIPFLAKPAPIVISPKAPILIISKCRRPKVSAKRPKKRRKAPDVSLDGVVIRRM
jgi:hypothetical protein